jgi:preprotein translocase subunit SecE
MPSATEQEKPDEKAPADEDRQEQAPSTAGQAIEYRSAATPAARGGGFFHIYKSGQGYWTRMGTAAGAGLVALLTASFLYEELPPRIDYLSNHHGVALGIAVGFLAAFSLLVYWYINKPTTADFLIATDSEMKKVNWTSRKELLGSTKVVIIFMFLIAFLLFAIDVLFGYVFHWVRVLDNPPF